MKTKVFSILFAVLLTIGGLVNLWASEITQDVTAYITLNQPAAALYCLDSVRVGVFTHDMGYMGVWIEGDSVPTVASTSANVMDSCRFYWRPSLGTYWRPLFIDTTGSNTAPVNGTGPVYVNSATGTVSAGAIASTTGLYLLPKVPKYAVFYDPSTPLPFPQIAENEYIWLIAYRTNNIAATAWVNKFTFKVRVEKDAP